MDIGAEIFVMWVTANSLEEVFACSGIIYLTTTMTISKKSLWV